MVPSRVPYTAHDCFLFERRYGHFYVEITTKMSLETASLYKKKSKIDSALMCTAEFLKYCEYY